VILGGGVAACLLLSAHRAVIFAIAQLFCTVPCTQKLTACRSAYERRWKLASLMCGVTRLVVLESGLGLESGLESIFAGLGLGLVAQRSFTYSQGNMEKFWGENVRSTPTSITSG